MQPIIAEETGAAVAWCIREGNTSAFDEAYDRAAEHFKRTEIDTHDGWTRFKSALAWPRTTHPQTPTATAQSMPTATKNTPRQELALSLTDKLETLRAQREISEEMEEDLLHGTSLTEKEAEEVEALLSTEVGQKLAKIAESIGAQTATLMLSEQMGGRG